MFDVFAKLVIIGYGIMVFFLYMAGSEGNNFSLESNVLIALVVSAMGSSIVHSLRGKIDSFLNQ